MTMNQRVRIARCWLAVTAVVLFLVVLGWWSVRSKGWMQLPVDIAAALPIVALAYHICRYHTWNIAHEGEPPLWLRETVGESPSSAR